jgi:chemotaxis protein CheC
MNAVAYTEDQLDALGELVNIAVGQAGVSLARVLNAHVRLSVPQARIIAASGVARAVSELAGEESHHTVARQAFFSAMRGEAIVLFGRKSGRDIADLLGHDPEMVGANEEVLLDISNILVSAVLNGLAHEIGARFGFQAPTVLGRGAELGELLEPASVAWSRALLIEVDFAVEARDFSCQLVLLMPEDAIERMRAVLNRILAAP